MKYMYVLGIETSCDETAAAVIKMDKKSKRLLVLSNIIASQIDIHKKYGGVIPEVAAREHVIHILPVIDQAINEAKINIKKIDFIAVTKGPGLITSLMSGMETARALAYAWNKPIIEVNHIEGHIFANFINLENSELNGELTDKLTDEQKNKVRTSVVEHLEKEKVFVLRIQYCSSHYTFVHNLL